MKISEIVKNSILNGLKWNDLNKIRYNDEDERFDNLVFRIGCCGGDCLDATYECQVDNCSHNALFQNYYENLINNDFSGFYLCQNHWEIYRYYVIKKEWEIEFTKEKPELIEKKFENWLLEQDDIVYPNTTKE